MLVIHNNEGRPLPQRDQRDCDDCLSHAGWRDEHPRILRGHGFERLGLKGREVAAECRFERLAFSAKILEIEPDAVARGQCLQVRYAASRERDVLLEVLRAADDPRRVPRGHSHRLLLVEFRILKCSEPANLRDQRRRQIRLLDEHALAKRRSNLRGKRPGNTGRRSGSRRGPQPRRLAIRGLSGDRLHAEHGSILGCLANDAVEAFGIDAADGPKQRPLTRDRLPGCVDEHRIALLSWLALQGQSDEVAETSGGHGVLVRKKAVVGVERQPGAGGHRLGEQERSQLSRRGSADGPREEEPNVGPIAGAGSLDVGGDA